MERTLGGLPEGGLPEEGLPNNGPADNLPDNPPVGGIPIIFY